MNFLRSVLIAALVFCGASADAGLHLHGDPGVHGWQFAKGVGGGGGQVTNIDVSPDGLTLVVGTDVGGGYIWNPAASQWVQLITTASMPGTDAGQGKSLNGIYSVVSAPSLSSRIYMVYDFNGLPSQNQDGFIFRSNDRGTTWVRTNFSTVKLDSGITSYKMFGPKMAVDPANPDIVYVGTPNNGSFVTTNGGTSWCSLPNVPTSSGIPDIGFAFDPTSATSSTTLCGNTVTATQGIYLSSNGNGIYHSVNGGTSFSLMAGSPSNAAHGKIASNGFYYTAGTTADAFTGAHPFRWNGSTWTDIFPPAGSGNCCITIVINPTTPTSIIAVESGGPQWISANSGGTWTGSATTPIRVATDIPWLANANESFMTVGDLVMDPITAGKIYFAEGIGVWVSTSVPNGSAITYTSQTNGIYELVNNAVISPPGGNPVVGNWDRAAFYMASPSVFPSNYGPNYTHPIEVGWALDWASATPSYISMLNTAAGGGVQNDSSFSTTGGLPLAWTAFAGAPSGLGVNYWGGGIASSTTTNTVLYLANDGDVFNTQDGGTTWARVAASTFGHGTRDAGSISTTVTNVVSGTASACRVTVSATEALIAGDQINLTGILGSPACNGFSNIIAVISGTVFETDKIFSGAYTSGGSGISSIITGWDHAYFLARQTVCADRVTANKFYIYNSNIAAGGGGVYSSTNGGVAWTQQFSGKLDTQSGNNDKLKCVPNLTGSISTAGHLFYTAGINGSNFKRSTDGGATWQSIATVGEIYAVGFGAVKSGGDYPTVYVAGTVNGVYGIFRGDGTSAQWAAGSGTGTGVTWTQIGPFPLNSTDATKVIEGDANTYGIVYIGTGNSVMYYTP